VALAPKYMLSCEYAISIIYKLYSFCFGKDILIFWLLTPMVHIILPFLVALIFWILDKYLSIFWLKKIIFTLLCGVEFLLSIIKCTRDNLSLLTGMDRGVNCSASACFYSFKVAQRKICGCNFGKRWMYTAREKCQWYV